MRLKCCVGGCKSTNDTHRLFVFPMKDMLRNLWMSFLVPTNPLLLGLSKEQLLRKRVCEKHFDKHQFDVEGKRIRFSYPCLFTDDEITHGEPLAAVGTVRNALSDHNYFKDQEDEEDDTLIIVDKILVIGRPGEDFHEHPSCFPVEVSISDNKVIEEAIRTVTIDHMYYTIKKIHIDHTYSKKDEDEDAWMDHVPFQIKSGTTHTPEAKLGTGEAQNDHSYISPDDAQSAFQEDKPTFQEDKPTFQEDEPTFQEDKPTFEGGNDQTESDSRLPTDELYEVMIDHIIEHPASPERDIFETDEPENPKKKTVFSWEKTELLEAEDSEDEPVLVPEAKIPDDLPTLSMFCDEPEKPSVEIAPSQPEAAVVPKDDVYRCVDCAVVVDGFTFWCVQCLCGVMCGACAVTSPHDIHYVLRAPKGSTRSQTQPVLLVIREQLQKEDLLNLYNVTDIDGVKVEVKLEPDEPLFPAAPDFDDPLALEPHFEELQSKEPHSEEPQSEEPQSEEPQSEEPQSEEPQSEEPQSEEPQSEKPQSEVGEIHTETVQFYMQLEPAHVESHTEAVQFNVESVQPEPVAVQLYLELIQPQSEAVQFYLESQPKDFEPHSEAEQFSLEAVNRGAEAVLLQVETTGGAEVDHQHKAAGPGNEAELRIDPRAEKRINNEAVGYHHPFKRPRLVKIRPGDKPSPTANIKVSDAQQQSFARNAPNIIQQTFLRLPNTTPSYSHKAQILPKNQPNDLRKLNTRPKSSPTEFVRPQSVHKGPNILKRSNPNKGELRKSTLLKQDKVQNNAKGSPLMRNLQINPGGSPLQVPQNVGFSELKVTSEPRRYETVIINSDDADVEILDMNDSENELDSRLHKENQDENTIGEEDNIDSRKLRLDKESEINDESDTYSSKDKESNIDDDDLDEDYRVDEQDRIDEDSTDETDSAEGVGRRTRQFTKTTVESQKNMVRTLTSEAAVQLRRLTSLDIRNWTDRSKSRKKRLK